MSPQFDAIVIGAGHNGLTCAAYLARAGLKVLVVEQYPSIGGMTNTEEVTLPGFASDTHAIGVQFANFSPAFAELGLSQYGFELIQPDRCWSHVFPDGRSLTVYRDLERTCQSIAQFSVKDADAWRRLYQGFLKQKTAICAAFNRPPPVAAAAEARNRPPDADQGRFERQGLRSWGDETFETEELRCLAAAWGVHVGAATEDVGGANMAWLFAMVIQHFGNNVVKGGMRQLPLALARCLAAHGGEVRCGALVRRIVVEQGRAVAVELADGERIRSGRLIVSSVHPRHLVLDLLGEGQVAQEVVREIRAYELGESVMVVYLALDRPPQFKAGTEAGQSVYVHPSPASLDYFDRIFGEARGGLLSAEPFALICHDTAPDPDRAPPGKGLMKLVVQPVPYVIQGDAAGRIGGTHWSEAKEPFADRVIELATRQYIPDLQEIIVKRVVHSPCDIERLLPSALRGTNCHGACVPGQVGAMRPIPAMGRYRSPIANVFLCGSGSHPGPGVTMAPGRNAAQIILSDLSALGPG